MGRQYSRESLHAGLGSTWDRNGVIAHHPTPYPLAARIAAGSAIVISASSAAALSLARATYASAMRIPTQ